MHVSNCTAFVFKKETGNRHWAARALNSCGICGDQFVDAEALGRHLAAPALPIDGTPNTEKCSTCGRCFASQRALRQHVDAGSCVTPAAKPVSEAVVASKTPRKQLVPSVIAEVTSDFEGIRLAHFPRQLEALRRHLPSKMSVKRAIAQGELTICGECVEETRRLHVGDSVWLCLDKEREAHESSAGPARSVRLVVLTVDGQSLTGDLLHAESWQVVRSQCPDGAAVVWKPSGMRSLGSHAGTLQASLPLLRKLASSQPLPLSRLEIGCSGLSLVALSESARTQLQALMQAGHIVHTFRALVHGSAGRPGESWVIKPPPGNEQDEQSVAKHELIEQHRQEEEDEQDEGAAEKLSSMSVCVHVVKASLAELPCMFAHTLKRVKSSHNRVV